jgi:hypothetical protein
MEVTKQNKYYSSLQKINLCLGLINWATRHEDIWESWCIDLSILDLSTSWKWMVSFTPRLLYPWWKNFRCPLDKRLYEPQDQSGRCGEEKILPLTRLELWHSAVQPIARCYTDCSVLALPFIVHTHLSNHPKRSITSYISFTADPVPA